MQLTSWPNEQAELCELAGQELRYLGGMKFPKSHPSVTAYYRDLERELFVLDHAKEYGDNLFIETRDENGVSEKTTLGAVKIMVCDEIMINDPVSKLRSALDRLLHDSTHGEAITEAFRVLRATERFGNKLS